MQLHFDLFNYFLRRSSQANSQRALVRPRLLHVIELTPQQLWVHVPDTRNSAANVRANKKGITPELFRSRCSGGL